ncbi:putative subunit of anaphase-promoting complex [Hamiltosporidium tvaerminnensis]|uniref:Putative subunit 3 of anaphase-promoting complex n=1 Tax=Hamiltosporidium tvaerminnensis TaxID=1176355 RepID=A0A4Q9LZU1_9MICR|nr:anaphase-promoting complex subunit cdc27 [Hamiltosporidium tvaerminnensis]TBU03432.1 putative subunit 3 of anaphase-promoting complex [Hamiltosporidium tvaerminnensis]TBU13330.1 putative subunit of anaphase-promoting complex [Hamiltosporidium tvaerminnensis]
MITFESKILLLRKYKSYYNAIFLTSALLQTNPNYITILGILYYESGQFSQALNILQSLSTTTSKYYESLCLYNLREYSKAIEILQNLISNNFKLDTPFNSEFDSLILPVNPEIVSELLGMLLTLNGEREKSLSYFQKAFYTSELPYSFQELLSENKFSDITKELKGFSDCFSNESSNKIFFANNICRKYFEHRLYLKTGSNIKNSKLVNSMVKKYSKFFPGLGSFFLAEVAKDVFESGLTELSQKLFEELRRRDHTAIQNMDVFSTVLWHSKDISGLGILCRELIRSNPMSYATWTSLGNYFSFKGDHHRATLCFKRSIFISKNYYAYTLLGHECILKNEYQLALRNFLGSCKMFIHNFNAAFGCGMVYSKTDKIDNAEFFFKKAIAFNSKNTLLRLLILQFYNRCSLYGRIVENIRDIFLGQKEYDSRDLGIILKEIFPVMISKFKSTETNELILLEMVDVLLHYQMEEEAKTIIDMVKTRGRIYFSKKTLIDNRKNDNKKEDFDSTTFFSDEVC